MYVGYKRLPLFWATQFPKKMTTSCVQKYWVFLCPCCCCPAFTTHSTVLTGVL